MEESYNASIFHFSFYGKCLYIFNVTNQQLFILSNTFNINVFVVHNILFLFFTACTLYYHLSKYKISRKGDRMKMVRSNSNKQLMCVDNNVLI